MKSIYFSGMHGSDLLHFIAIVTELIFRLATFKDAMTNEKEIIKQCKAEQFNRHYRHLVRAKAARIHQVSLQHPFVKRKKRNKKKKNA